MTVVFNRSLSRLWWTRPTPPALRTLPASLTSRHESPGVTSGLRGPCRKNGGAQNRPGQTERAESQMLHRANDIDDVLHDVTLHIDNTHRLDRRHRSHELTHDPPLREIETGPTNSKNQTVIFNPLPCNSRSSGVHSFHFTHARAQKPMAMTSNFSGSAGSHTAQRFLRKINDTKTSRKVRATGCQLLHAIDIREKSLDQNMHFF